MPKVEFNRFDPLSGKSDEVLNESIYGGFTPQMYLNSIMGKRRQDDTQMQQGTTPEVPDMDQVQQQSHQQRMQQIQQALMTAMQGQAPQAQEIDFYDPNMGKKSKMKIGNPDLGIDGLRSRADINSDEQMGYLSQAGQWRVSQPSGGYDPERYQMSWGVDPEAVPHISVDNLPKLYTSQDYMTRQQGFQQSMQQSGFEDQMQSGPETFHLKPEMQGAPVEVLDRLTQSDTMKDILFRQQLLGGSLEDKVREAMAIYQQIQQQQQQQQQGGMGSY